MPQPFHYAPFAPFLLPFFLTAGFAALSVSAGLWIKRRREARKKADAEQTARTLGLAFSEKDLFGLAPQLKAFEMFRPSRSRWGRKKPGNQCIAR